MRTIIVLSAMFLFSSVASGMQETEGTKPDCWIMQTTGSRASLRGICAVSDQVCWASGSGGTVLRTTDGGGSWCNVGPKNTNDMDFRDVHAWDADNAVIMCAGDPDRLYRTGDGGQTWKTVYEHPDAAAFFDGMVFDRAGKKGWLMGDPLDGRMFLLFTGDSGNTWVQMPPTELPEIPEGVAGFAASGTNIGRVGDRAMMIGLGGKSADSNKQMAMMAFTQHGKGGLYLAETPIPSHESAGIFSVVGLDDSGDRIVAVGGDYQKTDIASDNIAISEDAGLTWRLPTGAPPFGFRSVVVVVQQKEKGDSWLLAMGPSGTDRSADQGDSWENISKTGFHTASFVSGSETGWAAGGNGRIGKWRTDK